MYLYIKNKCFNCGSDIFSERLKYSIPCEYDIDENLFNKLKEIKDKKQLYEILYNNLLQKNKLFGFKYIYEIEKRTEEFLDMFKKALDSEPWSIQIAWFKRLYMKSSFSMIAPTGTGKTTFICIASVYFAKNGKKIYIILPTTVLVEQVYERIQNFMEKLGINLKVIAYLRKNKKEIKEQIKEGNFDILITSNQFLSKNFNILEGKKFDIIFVDDVDAFFKGSRNIERALILLGFTIDDINTAMLMINAKRKGDLDLIKKLSEELIKIRTKDHGILVLSSATGKVRGQRTKLYKELLGFSVGTDTTKIRNIIDTFYYPKKDIKEEVLDLIKKLEDGILIFVTREQGSDFAKKLAEYLKNNSIKAEPVLSEIKESYENIKRFAKGELNVLVGVAHFYGLLVRGLDLPHRVKYVIFTGIPKIRINLTKKEKNIQSLLILANFVKDLLSEEERKTLNIEIRRVNKNLKKLSSEALRLLSESFEMGKNLEGWLGSIREMLEKLYEKVYKYLENEEFLKRLEQHPDVSLKVINNEIWLNIPDVKTYIQASGRVSRLYAGGITKGLSIVFVDDEKLLRSLEKKLKLYFS